MNKADFAWKHGKVYDLSEVGGPKLRAVFHEDVPYEGINYKIKTILAGYVDDPGYEAYATNYHSYFSSKDVNPYRRYTYSRPVRAYVLEEEWQKHFPPAENEFGVVSP